MDEIDINDARRGIELTDPAPVVSERGLRGCTSCGASLDPRVMSDTAGPWTWPICSQCGAEFLKERRQNGAI